MTWSRSTADVWWWNLKTKQNCQRFKLLYTSAPPVYPDMQPKHGKTRRHFRSWRRSEKKKADIRFPFTCHARPLRGYVFIRKSFFSFFFLCTYIQIWWWWWWRKEQVGEVDQMIDKLLVFFLSEFPHSIHPLTDMQLYLYTDKRLFSYIRLYVMCVRASFHLCTAKRRG